MQQQAHGTPAHASLCHGATVCWLCRTPFTNVWTPSRHKHLEAAPAHPPGWSPAARSASATCALRLLSSPSVTVCTTSGRPSSAHTMAGRSGSRPTRQHSAALSRAPGSQRQSSGEVGCSSSALARGSGGAGSGGCWHAGLLGAAAAAHRRQQAHRWEHALPQTSTPGAGPGDKVAFPHRLATPSQPPLRTREPALCGDEQPRPTCRAACGT